MNKLTLHSKKIVIIAVFILLIVLCFCKISQTRKLDFSSIMKDEETENITLTIYCMHPDTLTDVPVSVDSLMKMNDVKKIVVSGAEIEKHIESFNEISKKTLTRVAKKSKCIDARLYYVFESKKNGKLFDAIMWGLGEEENSIFVNGVEVKETPLLYEVIIPFLPTDMADAFARSYLKD